MRRAHRQHASIGIKVQDKALAYEAGLCGNFGGTEQCHQ
jgi:hypothetical protein